MGASIELRCDRWWRLRRRLGGSEHERRMREVASLGGGTLSLEETGDVGDRKGEWEGIGGRTSYRYSVNTVSGGEGGTGTLVETAVGDVVVMSIPTISSDLGLVVLVILLDLRLLDLERAASNPQHIIELITPKVQAKVSKFHQKDIDIVSTNKLVNHKGTQKHQIEKDRKTNEQSWPKMATIYFVSRFAMLKNITKPIKTKHGLVNKKLFKVHKQQRCTSFSSNAS